MPARSTHKRMRRIGGLVASMFLLVISSPSAAFSLTAGGMAEVGVYVETTLPPPPPPTTTAPRVTIPLTTITPTTLPETTTSTTIAEPQTTEDSLLEELSPKSEGPADEPKGFVEQVKSVAKTTGDVLKNISTGTPVAEAAEAVLPEPVAAVVVPAIRTASTFVFPIGLAGAVVSFLALQQRIDSTDPKLRAAPIAHGDDVVTFS